MKASEKSIFLYNNYHQLKFLCSILFLTILFQNCESKTSDKGSSEFNFEHQGIFLNGVLNTPKNNKPKGIVLIVHGSGATDAVAKEYHYDIRQTLNRVGYSTYMWDKMGCGKSGGKFDYNQSVSSSASEVIAAINELKKKNIPGSESIALWGISRAGWIIPIVINRYKDIKFWISVSGVDEKENFGHLLKENLKISGKSNEYCNMVVNEWINGNRIQHSGGNFESYHKATINLDKDKFWLRFTNGGIGKKSYEEYQPKFMNESFDYESGLQVYIKNFTDVLSGVDCPVLAIFGEKDMNVDWRKTKALYQKTLIHNILTIKTFPNTNHNLFECKTGGFYEFEDNKLEYKRPNAYLDFMYSWVNNLNKK